MTGFKSKRQAAQGKVTIDDAQGYIADYEAALKIAYEIGFENGKKAQRKPLTDKELRQIFRESSRYDGDDFQGFARAIEAAHNIKEQP
jgi:hypothetical protein